jgi:glycosyltransferase involved in cell wall biosynthesis
MSVTTTSVSIEKAFSIIIPTREHRATLELCLSALSNAGADDYECIVIDDASPCDIASAVARFPVKYCPLETRKGSAISRNEGAALATSAWLLFLDADCLITSQTLEEIRRIIQSHPEEVAFFGSYDDEPFDPAPVSQFRNLLHHYFHQTGASDTTTFWTGCGAIRKDIFWTMGGFEPVDAGIRDIELGYRLTRAGYKIHLYRQIQVKHLKRWTLRKMIIADITKRGIPWTRLLFKYGLNERNLNLQTAQRIAGLGFVCALLGLLLSFWKSAFLLLGLIGFALFLGFNAPVFRMFVSKKGVRFLVWAIPLQAVYYLSGLASLILGVLGHYSHRLRGH